MRLRDQLIAAVALGGVTYIGLIRIAEAKCDAAAGSHGLPMRAAEPGDFEAFMGLQAQLVALGQAGLSARLDELNQRRELFVAPALGPERWAVYVESLGLVRRIYVRRVALRDPRRHLYPHGSRDNIPINFQDAFAWLSLGGAMRHELAHYDGALEEREAYLQELAWYEEIRRSDFLNGLEGEERAAWSWGLESAILSARKAARQAGAV